MEPNDFEELGFKTPKTSLQNSGADFNPENFFKNSEQTWFQNHWKPFKVVYKEVTI